MKEEKPQKKDLHDVVEREGIKETIQESENTQRTPVDEEIVSIRRLFSVFALQKEWNQHQNKVGEHVRLTRNE